MSESKHTPGPWTMTQLKQWPFRLLTTAANGKVISCTSLEAYGTDDTSAAEANARLGNEECIANEQLRAAAPDMLEACKRLTMNRHYHATMDGTDICDNCGLDLRDEIHYLAGESRRTDLEFARAAIAKAEGRES